MGTVLFLLPMELRVGIIVVKALHVQFDHSWSFKPLTIRFTRKKSIVYLAFDVKLV